MARYFKRTSKIISADDFRGLDLSEGEKQNFSSSVYMRNFKITPQRRLKKRCGFKTLCRGIKSDSYFACEINGTGFFLYKKGTQIKAVKISDGATADTFSAGSGAVGYFFFGGKAYILGKGIFLSFDGQYFDAVEPYIPTIAVTAGNSGGGVIHESLNLLSDKAKISYSPDGQGSAFKLPESCDAVVKAEYNGSVVPQSSYTYSAFDKTVTFNFTPDAGVDTLNVTFRLDNSVLGSMETPGDRFTVYGGDFDSRVFAFGKNNILYYSDVTDKGPDVSYFPADNFIKVGDGTYKVTALVRHYDRLVVFTERETWYISPSSVTYDGYRKPSFPIYPLNSAVGCAGGGAAFIDNFPVTLSFDGIYRFGKTSIRDERNAERISDRVSRYLTPRFLSNAAVIDCEREKELWCAYGGEVLIYNYGLDAFYIYDGIKAKYLFIYDNSVAFYDGGNICVFDEALSEDDCLPFAAVCESGFVVIDKQPKKRRLKRVAVSLLPESAASVVLTVIPNRGDSHAYGANGEISRNRFDFTSMDFENFTFECEARPENICLRAGLSSFEALKIRIENSRSRGRATVCGVSLTVD